MGSAINSIATTATNMGNISDRYPVVRGGSSMALIRCRPARAADPTRSAKHNGRNLGYLGKSAISALAAAACPACRPNNYGKGCLGTFCNNGLGVPAASATTAICGIASLAATTATTS
jgi:hypothetical protein